MQDSFFLDNINKHILNTFLKSIGCPYMYKDSLPRTGFSKVMNEVIEKNFVYLSHFTINLKTSTIQSYIAPDTPISICHKNSHNYELPILRWLHSNNFIDLTLCMIEDKIDLTFNCDNLKPSKFILDKFKDKKYTLIM